jgi:hypothetical protein
MLSLLAVSEQVEPAILHHLLQPTRSMPCHGEHVCGQVTAAFSPQLGSIGPNLE